MARPLGLEPKSNSFGDYCVTNYTTSAYGAGSEIRTHEACATAYKTVPIGHYGIPAYLNGAAARIRTPIDFHLLMAFKARPLPLGYDGI